jgi:predicted ATPase
MKIVISGSTCLGKSTLIKDFLKKFPMYKTPETSYRDVIKENNLKHSSQGTEEGQKLILDYLLDEAQNYSKDENIVFDRCVLDNLVYSSWLHLNEKVSEKFLDETRILTRETLKMFDIIFFIPLTNVAPVPLVDDGLRDVNPQHREEIDMIFKTFQESYSRGDGRVFPKTDCPAFIEIFGNSEERIKMIELYLDPKTGKPYGEDESLMSNIILP